MIEVRVFYTFKMKNKIMSNLITLAIFTFFLCFGLCAGGEDCYLKIEGLPIQNMNVTTNATWNKTVLTMDITYPNNVIATTIHVMKEESSSAYFEILNNEVFTTSCPSVGESHLIQAYLENDSMDILDECSFNISVTVVPSVIYGNDQNPPLLRAALNYYTTVENDPSQDAMWERENTNIVIIKDNTSGSLVTAISHVPQISVHDNVTVPVSSLVDDLDVVNYTFANANTCSNFSCSVSCTNDEKSFWIYRNMIQTSPHNTTFDFLYDLDLTCYDGGPQNNKTNSSMVQVNFIWITSGTSAELSTLLTRASVGFLLCLVHILNKVF